MQAKHTPGPWEAQPKYAERGKFAGHRAVYAYGGGLIAYLPKGVHDDIDAANARLISAAPRMLAALEQCERFLLGRFDSSAELMVVRAAIAQARGA